MDFQIGKSGKFVCGIDYRENDLYYRDIVVIESKPNYYEEIITGIEFKIHPGDVTKTNNEDIYVILRERLDNSRSGYQNIKKYYLDNDELSIYKMFAWFNMSSSDREKSIKVGNDGDNVNYSDLSNSLVRLKLKK